MKLHAAQVYTSVLRKSLHGASARVLLYLARAHYDADRLGDARATLLRALHLAPADHKLHFNVALTMQARPRESRKSPRAGTPKPCKSPTFRPLQPEASPSTRTLHRWACSCMAGAAACRCFTCRAGPGDCM